MLKAADDEERHRQIGSHHPARQILGGQGQQHPGRHQEVAEDAQDHGIPRRECALPRRQLYGERRQLSAGVVQLAAEGTAGGGEHSARGVAQIHHAPVFQHPAHCGLTVQQGDDDQRIAGKELRPHQDHHAKAEGKQQPADDAGRAYVCDGVGGGVGDGPAHGDEEPGQDCQKEHLHDGHPRLLPARRGIVCGALRRSIEVHGKPSCISQCIPQRRINSAGVQISGRSIWISAKSLSPVISISTSSTMAVYKTG